MELWIRSQDKQSLVKTDNLYISVGNYICYYVEKGKEQPNTYYRPAGELARYETNERALEVLDEIQKLLVPISEYKQEIDNLTINFKNSIDTAIYEMPEE